MLDLNLREQDQELDERFMWFDKITFHINGWRIESQDPVSFHSFVQALAPQTVNGEHNEWDGESRPPTGWIFCRPGGQEAGALSFPIHQSHNLHINAGAGFPLFGGKMKIGNPVHTGNILRSLQLELSINPTRFFARNDLPTSLTGPFSHFASYRRRRSPRVNGCGLRVRQIHRGLDGKDNLFHSDWAHAAEELDWERLIQRNLTASIEAIQDEISRACRETRTTAFLQNTEIVLRQAEVYCDFRVYDDAAIGTMDRIKDLLNGYGRGTATQWFDTHDAEVRAPCYRIHLTRNRLLRVYAKSHNRIRFEVEYNLQCDSTHLSDPAPTTEGETHRQRSVRRTGTIEELTERIMFLRPRCQQILRDVFNFISNIPPARGNASICETVLRLYTVFGMNYKMCGTTLDHLVHNGQIILDHRNDLRRPYILQLVKEGILVRSSGNSGGRHTFLPAPEYGQMFQAMR